MNSKKYIGMDVYQATSPIAVMDSSGKVVMDSVIETKAGRIVDFIQGVRGTLWVTFEEATSAAWLYDLLKPHVAKVVVCDPGKNALPGGFGRQEPGRGSDHAGLLGCFPHERGRRIVSHDYRRFGRPGGRGMTRSGRHRAECPDSVLSDGMAPASA
jgi:hypothetical protein